MSDHAIISERRRFTMHPKLLLDVIQRQAGTLAKAILEGLTNSIDAGSDHCWINVTPEAVSIEDDGQGILTLEHIEKFFETFGQPHDESEKKIFGTFRMGRGQAFSFGVNTWRTGTFEMVIDVKKNGLDYHLKKDLRSSVGCRIDIKLYEKLTPSDLLETVNTIRKWAKYSPKEVIVNGETVNCDIMREKWDHVTPEAYIRINSTQTLSVYNLGIHTMDFSQWKFGVGGVVVSRQQLKVNFARNDIQSDCPVWRKIKPLIDQKGQEKISHKLNLSDGERQRMINLIMEGEPPVNFRTMRLLEAANGRRFSISQLERDLHKYNYRITAAPFGDQIADRVLQQRIAFVLSDDCMAMFFKSGRDLVDKLHALACGSYDPKWQWVNFKTVAKDINNSYVLIDQSDYTLTERAWIGMATRCVYLLCKSDDPDTMQHRRVVLGDSSVAGAWTDGSSYIAISRSMLNSQYLDVEGFTALGMVLAHELCHDDSSAGTHVHSHEFYQNFHDLVLHRLGAFVSGAMGRLHAVFKEVGKTITRKNLKDLDKIVRGERELKKILDKLGELHTDASVS